MSFYVCSITEFNETDVEKGISILSDMGKYFIEKYPEILTFNVHKDKNSNKIVFYEEFSSESVFTIQSKEFLDMGKKSGLFDLIKDGYNPDTGEGNWEVYFLEEPFFSK